MTHEAGMPFMTQAEADQDFIHRYVRQGDIAYRIHYTYRNWIRHDQSPFARATMLCRSRQKADEYAACLTKAGHRVDTITPIPKEEPCPTATA